MGSGSRPFSSILRPSGVRYRVGDPTLLRSFYVPQVSLEDGVERALAAVGLMNRGHEVTLYDANEEPGGTLRYSTDLKEFQRVEVVVES